MKNINYYLPYKLEVYDEEIDEVFEACGFNYDTNEYLVYTNNGVENYCADLLKPILKPIESLLYNKEVLLELTDYDLINLKDDIHYWVHKLNLHTLEIIFKNHIDIFSNEKHTK